MNLLFPDSHRVVPGMLPASEHPGSLDDAGAREKISGLSRCGVRQAPPADCAAGCSDGAASPVANRIAGGLLGVAVGDALGVPVEFASRSACKSDPVTGMRGYGQWNQPPGTWSDDTSMTLCTAESLLSGFDLEAIAESFVRWAGDGYWTAWGEAFDIGGTTRAAISRLKRGVSHVESGEHGEMSNGNGSLMRILPVALYFSRAPRDTLLDRLHEVSAITHAHPRSMMACGIYGLMAVELLSGAEPLDAYRRAMVVALEAYGRGPMREDFRAELRHFGRLMSGSIDRLPEARIESDGYVVHTLEASAWCLLTAGDFSSAVLKAVNLGGDTDTTAAVTGGLAGVCYGLSAIPEEWLSALARREDIEALAVRFAAVALRDEQTGI